MEVSDDFTRAGAYASMAPWAPGRSRNGNVPYLNARDPRAGYLGFVKATRRTAPAPGPYVRDRWETPGYASPPKRRARARGRRADSRSGFAGRRCLRIP